MIKYIQIEIRILSQEKILNSIFCILIQKKLLKYTKSSWNLICGV